MNFKLVAKFQHTISIPMLRYKNRITLVFRINKIEPNFYNTYKNITIQIYEYICVGWSPKVEKKLSPPMIDKSI